MKAALFLCGILASLALPLAADTDATAAAREQITKRSTDYAAAWAKHDAKAIAAFYAEEADLVIASGETFTGRDGVERAMGEWFESVLKDTTVTERIEKVRLVGKDVAIVDSDLQIKGAANDDAAGHFHVLTILSKHDGKWLSETTRAIKYAQE
jgi:uncharacterized protein (TIGR02246 family)